MVENDASGSDNHRYHENEPAQPDSEGKTETPANPYRSPKTTVPSPLKPGKKRLTVFDWVLAIFFRWFGLYFYFPNDLYWNRNPITYPRTNFCQWAAFARRWGLCSYASLAFAIEPQVTLE